MAMQYNELRKDYLLDRWAVIATERGRRPTDFAKKRIATDIPANCPMCPGNEHMTPPATLVYMPFESGIRKGKEEGDFRSKNWLLRCVPNMYPAFAPPINPVDTEKIMKSSSFGYAIGHHEVIVESPIHDGHPADAPLMQVEYLVSVYKDRLTELSKKPYIQYIQIFRNHGTEAGASLTHAHSQVIATPFVPAIPKAEILTSKIYFEAHQNCFFCDLIKAEVQTPRLVMDGEYFVVFAPYASISPMEFWIVPKRHAPNFLDLTKPESEALALTLKKTLKALKNLINDPPYNYGIHLALNSDAKQSYHWHFEVFPALSTWAGFEKSTGTYINTVSPENAATALKAQLEK
jgi:UDPglucose--hexose-1-phosphate uridylyltransferase